MKYENFENWSTAKKNVNARKTRTGIQYLLLLSFLQSRRYEFKNQKLILSTEAGKMELK